MKTLDDLMADLTFNERAPVNVKVPEMRLDSRHYKVREALAKTQKQQAETMGIAPVSVVVR